MAEKKFNILMLNMANEVDWQAGVVNRNYFILHSLLKDQRVNKILAVDFVPVKVPRPFGLKRAIKYFFQNVLNPARGKVLTRDPYSVYVELEPRLRLYSSMEMFLNPEQFWSKLNKFKHEFLQGDTTLVWNYNPFLAEAFEKIPSDLTVFDTVDNWLDHASYAQCATKLKAGYEIVEKRAGVVFAVAKEMEGFYKTRKDVKWIPNGVDLESFTANSKVPADLTNVKRPIIGYVGTIQQRIDFDLVAYLADKNPDKTVVMVGPVWDGVKDEVQSKLAGKANVYFTGRRPYQEIAGYINQFDVAIIPHKIEPFIHSTNPMKMYDYLACGRPVVSTPGAGVDMFPESILVATSPEEFNQKVRQAIKDDNPAKRQARLEQVRPHSWQSRASQMLDIIEAKLKP